MTACGLAVHERRDADRADRAQLRRRAVAGQIGVAAAEPQHVAPLDVERAVFLLDLAATVSSVAIAFAGSLKPRGVVERTPDRRSAP